MKYLPFTLLMLLFDWNVTAQTCDPPYALRCNDAKILCDVTQLDGLTCQNIDFTNATGPNPTLCLGSGIPENTQWWGFYGTGEVIEFHFEFNPADCTNPAGCRGIQAGIVGDCIGNAEDCNADCNSSSFNLSFISNACQAYYLWVDGCCKDVCPYTISVLKGQAAKIPTPVEPPRVIGDVLCQCQTIDICTDYPPGGCSVRPTWTKDGVALPQYDDKLCIYNYELSGDPFEICVTWTLASGGDVCDEVTSCTEVLLPPKQIIEQPPLVLCYEQQSNGSYKWSCEGSDTTIYSSCIDPPCEMDIMTKEGCCATCKRSITLLPERPVGEKFVFNCTGEEYVTEDGKTWPVSKSFCNESITFQAPFGEEDILCDTTYHLVLENYNPAVAFEVDTTPCYPPKVRLSTSIDWTPECLKGDVDQLGFWVAPSGDTVFGSSLTIDTSSNTGNYEFFIRVKYQDPNNPSVLTTCDYNPNIHFEMDSFVLAQIVHTECLTDTTIRFDLLLNAGWMKGDSFYIVRQKDTFYRFLNNDSIQIIEDYVLSGNDFDTLHICKDGPDSCCFDYVVHFDNCIGTSVAATQLDGVSVWYKPSTEVLSIRPSSGMKSLTLDVFDLHGQRIYHSDLSGVDAYVSTSLWQAGLYVARLSRGDKSMIYRFVKSR